MKTIINDLKQHKIIILFVIFWILIISCGIIYTIDNSNRIKANKEMIQHNHDDIMSQDSTLNILIKNDSIIIDKLNKLEILN